MTNGPRRHGTAGTRILVLSMVLVLLSWTLSIPVAAAESGGTSTPIKHVIIITMENHSFDNIFGKYPLDQNASNQSLISSITRPVNLLPGNMTESLTPVANGSFSTGNPEEGYSAYHLDWNNGKMNGFLKNSGPNSLKYFTASQMAVEWVMAQQYALGDMYFSSILSETVPNRLFGLAGFSPVINDYGPPPYISYNQTVFHQLSSNNITWGYYLNSTDRIMSPMSLIHNIGDYSSNLRNWSTFYSQLANNTLPSVSWLMPIHAGAEKYSQHPSYNMLAGELWLLYTVNKIMPSPEWNSTAIFINYDEGGGYYDHVPPPVVAGHQLGIRVPLIVISPYAKENYVSKTVLSHTSILAFIDFNWKLPALNRLVQESNLPLDFFNFNEAYSGGSIERAPLTFSPAIMNLMPETYDFGPATYHGITTVSSLFPMVFQIPLNERPYNSTGSSGTTLANLGYGISVDHNFAYVPFYQEHGLIAVVLIAGSAALYYYTRRLLLSRKG